MRNLFLVGLLCLVSVAKADEAASVLKKEGQPTVAEPVVADSSAANATCCNNSCSKNVRYKGQRNIAPCAVEKNVNVSFCDKHLDACCNCVSTVTNVNVPVCVPPCACKETVSTTRGGRRVVYDYGRYEVVVLARKNGNVEVDYRKRLLDK